jgi:beta-xylosidase
LALAKRLDHDAPDHIGHPIGVYVGEIDLETGNSLSEFRLVRLSSEGNGIAEGPHLFKRGEYYYLITAEGGTELVHQEWVMRSKGSPLGPWELGEKDSINPMIFNGDDSEVRQTGHMDMVEGVDGRWWAVFLAVRPVHAESGNTQLSQLGRETFLAPVEWHDDWPIINGRRPITINMDIPGLLRTDETFREEITFAPGIDLAKQGWYRMRTPLKKDYALLEGTLTMYGSPYSITAAEAPTMFLRKQLSFQGHWTVEIEASPQLRHQAGIAIWWSKYSYASVAIRGTEKGRELVFKYPNHENDDFEVRVT